jgi:hypothetical protein
MWKGADIFRESNWKKRCLFDAAAITFVKDPLSNTSMEIRSMPLFWLMISYLNITIGVGRVILIRVIRRFD